MFLCTAEYREIFGYMKQARIRWIVERQGDFSGITFACLSDMSCAKYKNKEATQRIYDDPFSVYRGFNLAYNLRRWFLALGVYPPEYDANICFRGLFSKI